jgi:hypothetical protein
VIYNKLGRPLRSTRVSLAEHIAPDWGDQQCPLSGMVNWLQALDLTAEKLLSPKLLNCRIASGCTSAFQGNCVTLGPTGRCVRLVVVAFLIVSFVSLIIVFLKVSLPGVILFLRAVSRTFALSLLVCFVLRIVQFGALFLLEKRSS